MRNVRRRFLQRIAAALLAILILTGCGTQATTDPTGDEQGSQVTTTTTITSESTTDYMNAIKEEESINIWYTNDELTPYIKTCALMFSAEHDIDVSVELVSSIDYLESINKETLNGNVADVYILNTEMLEKAYLAGLAEENTDSLYNNYSYPDIALTASTYKGKLLGYPLYYDTSFFLYNKDYVSAPASFQEIIDFSNNYEGDEYPGIETIVQWDVLDLFFSYGFVGEYMNLGGIYGDDASVVDIANDNVIEAVTFFKELNQTLYFDADDSNYNEVLKKFLEGKILFTMGDTEHLADIITSGINYGICTIPALNENLDTKAVSINYTAVVNPYSGNKATAQRFAKALTYEYAENFYASVKKLPARRLDVYPNEEWKHIAEQYEDTAILPKLMATTNYWMELEVMMNGIWKEDIDGEDIEIDSSLPEEEQEALSRKLIREKIKSFVAMEITELDLQMKLQID
ncbi:MAG: extracellular solute-binding protein [Lachnospiraceae bacterium]|nr:extracellular solute-binding protein [Lachnospiraceae bacterium]